MIIGLFFWKELLNWWCFYFDPWTWTNFVDGSRPIEFNIPNTYRFSFELNNQNCLVLKFPYRHIIDHLNRFFEANIVWSNIFQVELTRHTKIMVAPLPLTNKEHSRWTEILMDTRTEISKFLQLFLNLYKNKMNSFITLFPIPTTVMSGLLGLLYYLKIPWCSFSFKR